MQFCFGYFIASLLLSDNSELEYSNDATLIINKYLNNEEKRYTSLVWWITKRISNNFNLSISEIMKKSLPKLDCSKLSNEYWHFFPEEIPDEILKKILQSKNLSCKKEMASGWLIDAFNNRVIDSFSDSIREQVQRVFREEKDINYITLYEWIAFIKEQKKVDRNDPRLSEWTILEIIKEICQCINLTSQFSSDYIEQKRWKNQIQMICVHPANFLIPKIWIEKNEKFTWENWKKLCTDNCIKLRGYSIIDPRYSPIERSKSLFDAEQINYIRGLGLIFYGLLHNNFELPYLWNGPAHTKVLSRLPSNLLHEIACSSWSLGVLLGCLSPRVMETKFFKLGNQSLFLDDDTLKDPIMFLDSSAVEKAVQKSQDILEKYQLSTFNHNARQLIPISIRQLTDPRWEEIFRGRMDGNE